MMMTVVAFVMVVVMVAFHILVTFFTRFVTFFTRFVSFILVLVGARLGLLGSARHSGYRNVRSTASSRIRGARSSSYGKSGFLGRCRFAQTAVISGRNNVARGRGSAKGDSSKDYRSLGSNHFQRK
jgi:hypothetical protein